MTGNNRYPVDLVALVPDKNMEAAVKGLLSRPQALGIRKVNFNVYVHIERDPGCYHRSHDFLRPMVNTYNHALVMLDRVGCGREELDCNVIERTINDRLNQSGWGNRAAALVLDPELEVWVWSDSPEVAACLSWPTNVADMRRWLAEQELWPEEAFKPMDPKLAVEQVLRHVKKPRSSSVYEQLARRVSFQRCIDPAFRKFKKTVQKWFGR